MDTNYLVVYNNGAATLSALSINLVGDFECLGINLKDTVGKGQTILEEYSLGVLLVKFLIVIFVSCRVTINL